MAVLALLLALAAGAAAQDAVLAGRVTAVPRVTRRAPADDAYADRELSTARRLDYKHLSGVVVYAVPVDTPSALVPVPAAGALAVEKAWRGLRLTPEFQAVAPGADVVFRSAAKDPVTVVAGGGSAGPLAVALAPGEAVRRPLPAPGLYRLSCLEDARAEARVFVAGPHFAVADREGRYELRLPPGRYSVTAWHERFPPLTEEWAAAAGERRALDFQLTVRTLPEVP